MIPNTHHISKPRISIPPRITHQAKHLLIRPSVRLKSALCLLVTLITFLLILAITTASSSKWSSVVIGGEVINTVPAQGSPADIGEGKNVAAGKDAHLVDDEIQRSFEEPDFALLSAKQPHEIGCEVALVTEGAPIAEAGVLVYLGIFSTAERRGRRDLYRKVILPDFPPNLVTVKFILGLPPIPDKSNRQAVKHRAQLVAELSKESEEHNDIVLLPIIDNIDLGKTHEYFKHVAKTFAGPSPVKGRPRFVMKADDDTLLVMPNLISAFKDLNCATNIYWGTSAGRSGYFGEYFRGLAYAMSWPLVQWIGTADMPLSHTTKIEDARTGQWLRHLDPITDPIHRIDMGWTMGDWNQLDVSVETVGLHWLKLDEWVVEQHDRIINIWAEADRPYTHEHGVPPKLSIAKGKLTPQQAQAEHERQKELGWDVGGNVNDMK